MRRVVVAAVTGVTVFALTSAAASSIDVTGPFNPLAGSGTARVCDIGPITLTTDPLSGDPLQYLNSLTLTSSHVPNAEGCAGAMIYVKAQSDLIGGYYYMKIPATGDYTTTGADFYFDENPAHPNKIYVSLEMGSADQVKSQPLLGSLVPDTILGTVNWVVTTSPLSSM